MRRAGAQTIGHEHGSPCGTARRVARVLEGSGSIRPWHRPVRAAHLPRRRGYPSLPSSAVGRKRCLLVLLCLLVVLACASRAARVLYESPSSVNGRVIVVEQPSGLRQLLFRADGALQSTVLPGHPEWLELAYTRAAVLGLALVPEPQRALLVGLGGGALPMFVHHACPRARIDVVDIDPVVVHAARQYFGFKQDERLRVTIEDGRRFLAIGSGQYDLVILDAYGRSGIPRHLMTLEFLEAVKRRLSPGGVVVGNLWASVHNPLYPAMLRTYAASFRSVCVVPVRDSGNRIVLGQDGPLPLSTPRILEAARAFAQRHRLLFDLEGYAATGCSEETPGPSVPVLYDDPGRMSLGEGPRQ
jgi:spermidine synthase